MKGGSDQSLACRVLPGADLWTKSTTVTTGKQEARATFDCGLSKEAAEGPADAGIVPYKGMQARAAMGCQQGSTCSSSSLHFATAMASQILIVTSRIGWCPGFIGGGRRWVASGIFFPLAPRHSRTTFPKTFVPSRCFGLHLLSAPASTAFIHHPRQRKVCYL